MNIYIVRHGQTEFNRDYKMQGWLDSPLLPESLDLAHQTGQGFKLDEIDFDKVYASDAPRAIITAENIIKGMEADFLVHQEPLIKEMNFGQAEGRDIEMVWNRVAQQFGYKDRDDLYSQKDSSERLDLLHQNEDFNEAESLLEFHQRIASGLANIVEASRNENHKNVLVVAHGLTILGLLKHAGWQDSASMSFSNLSISIINASDEYAVKSVNKSYIE
ncbi:MAG: histidine phosphatase family protein [Erysipelothrix sp.]|nr:histidine phosphatase family protein [Erysipelothrix sp.]